MEKVIIRHSEMLLVTCRYDDGDYSPETPIGQQMTMQDVIDWAVENEAERIYRVGLNSRPNTVLNTDGPYIEDLTKDVVEAFMNACVEGGYIPPFVENSETYHDVNELDESNFDRPDTMGNAEYGTGPNGPFGA